MAAFFDSVYPAAIVQTGLLADFCLIRPAYGRTETKILESRPADCRRDDLTNTVVKFTAISRP